MQSGGIGSEKPSASGLPLAAVEAATPAPSITLVSLGICSYRTARLRQDELISLRTENRIPDTIIYCEHEPVLTPGRRLNGCSDPEIPQRIGSPWNLDQWREHGIDVVHCSRGGEATYHGPGQLVIYPVISLRDRRIGVADFVATISQAICLFLNDRYLLKLGLAAEFDIRCPGIWVPSSGARLKIGSVGLRICRGVSDHGFSVNMNCDLVPFAKFSPCGQKDSAVTSVAALTGIATGFESAASEIHRQTEQLLNPDHCSGKLPVRKD